MLSFFYFLIIIYLILNIYYQKIMKKNKLFTIFFLLFIFMFQNTYANVTVENEKIEKKTTMKVIGKKIIVDWDITFQSYTTIPYDLEVKGNVIFWDDVKVLWNINASWDIHAGNKLVIYKEISAKNIYTWNQLVANKIVTQEDLILNWKSTITSGISVWWNFEWGSDFILYWNSQIEWNMKVERDTKIYGTLYVYWDLKSKENFKFDWKKLKLYWDFRTLKKSEIEGRIYIYGTPARRSYYTNKIKYNYLLKSKKHIWFMKKVDPVLNYELSNIQIIRIHQNIQNYEYNISQQKSKIIVNAYKYSQQQLIQEIEKLKSIELNMIKYINNYISSHQRDTQEWKIIQFERNNEVINFIYNYIY